MSSFCPYKKKRNIQIGGNVLFPDLWLLAGTSFAHLAYPFQACHAVGPGPFALKYHTWLIYIIDYGPKKGKMLNFINQVDFKSLYRMPQNPPKG